MVRILTIIFVLFGTLGYSADSYVRKGATGLNDGSDWVNAWNGFDQISWGGMAASDTLYVAAGTYVNHMYVGVSGTSSSNMFIVKRSTSTDHGTETGWFSFYDDTVVLNGAEIIIFDEDYVHIDGVTTGGFRINGITGQSTNYTLEVQNSTGAKIEYLTVNISDNEDEVSGPKFISVTDFTMRYCTLEYLPADGMKFVSITDSLFEHNHIGPHITSLSAKHSDAIEVQVSSGITFRYNTVDFAGDQLHFSILSGASGQWSIYGNLFIGVTTEDQGIVIKTNSTDASTGPLYIYNNVFYDIGTPGSTLSNTTAIFKNNIFYSNSNANFGSGTITSEYNYWGTGTNPAETGEQVGGNPFTDSSNSDFRLMYSSSAIDNGIDLSGTFTTDRNGVLIPQGPSWDIGAYEYVIGNTGSTQAGSGNIQTGTGGFQ